jgi:phosphoribosylformylglycinamidine cyclo-ligase
MSSKYRESGVDQNKAGRALQSFSDYLKTRPSDPNVVTGIGPFASCYSITGAIRKMNDPLLVTCCDGVGTKALLALHWNELSGLGQDLVAMNINDLLCTGASPLLFLDYYACGRLEEDKLTGILVSIQRACELAHCTLVGGETAQMADLYSAQEFDLAGFAVGVVDKSQMLGPHRVTQGALLLAIESSGFHSNGYSLVRKLVKDSTLQGDDPLPWNPTCSWKETLLRPTHIYTKALTSILSHLQAAAHITGGGLFENLARVIPEDMRAVVQKNLWPISPLFLWAREQAGMTETELLSTFNCGVGMILVASPDNAHLVQTCVESAGLRSWKIGTVEKGGPERVLWR